VSAAWRSGELAEAAGVNQQTLRYYERRGSLAEPRRSPGGHRLYPAEALTVLRVIKTAQRLGFTLDEVAELVDLGTHRHGRRKDGGLQRRARTKLAEIESFPASPWCWPRGPLWPSGGPNAARPISTVLKLICNAFVDSFLILQP
jgi:DNA-binding transcriptional MerR regulator